MTRRNRVLGPADICKLASVQKFDLKTWKHGLLSPLKYSVSPVWFTNFGMSDLFWENIVLNSTWKDTRKMNDMWKRPGINMTIQNSTVWMRHCQPPGLIETHSVLCTGRAGRGRGAGGFELPGHTSARASEQAGQERSVCSALVSLCGHTGWFLCCFQYCLGWFQYYKVCIWGHEKSIKAM